jgi:hypothetical protein
MPVGVTLGADGTPGAQPGRFGKTGEQIVSSAHGKYYEATHRGSVYCASTGATGQAPGTTIGTTAMFTLWNPSGSGKRLKVMRASLGYISGTLGAGTIFYCVNNSPTTTLPSSGTAVTPVNCDIGAANNSVAKVGYGQTLPAGPTALRPFASIDAEAAASTPGPRIISEDVDGEFVVEPGCGLSLEGVTAAGTSPVMSAGFTWEEVPIV